VVANSSYASSTVNLAASNKVPLLHQSELRLFDRLLLR